MKTKPLFLLLGASLISPAFSQVTEELPNPFFPLVQSGFSSPLALVDAAGTLLVVERRGRVVELEGRAVFLNIESRVLSGGERGLLGMAVPPGFGSPGKRHFYVNYTRAGDGATVVSRFLLEDGGADLVGDAASEEILLTIAQPFSNHNAGDIHFGSDGFLYIATGDGGSGNDPGDRAQDLGTKLGKMLRIDVEGPGPGNGYAIPGDNPFIGSIPGEDEIWAYGLRNPFRFSFDRATGDLWIGDVGQNRIEEVDFLPAGTGAGSNFGWDYYEGDFRNTSANNGSPIPPPPFADTVAPVFQYSRSDAQSGVSITGGVVYRGDRFPRFSGRYFVIDFSSRNLWSVRPTGGGSFESEYLGVGPTQVAAFGEDSDGEVYLVSLSGSIFALEDTLDRNELSITAEGPDENGMVTVTWGVEAGETYQLAQSSTLNTWIPIGDPILATLEDARSISVEVDVSGVPNGRIFFQAGRLDTPAN